MKSLFGSFTRIVEVDTKRLALCASLSYHLPAEERQTFRGPEVHSTKWKRLKDRR